MGSARNERRSVRAARGHLGVVQWLAGQPSVEINKAGPNGKAALRFAAEEGKNLEVVRCLLGHSSADSELRDKEGTTALKGAARKGHHDIARLLTAKIQEERLAAERAPRLGRAQRARRPWRRRGAPRGACRGAIQLARGRRRGDPRVRLRQLRQEATADRRASWASGALRLHKVKCQRHYNRFEGGFRHPIRQF